jgi:hypothetical protein
MTPAPKAYRLIDARQIAERLSPIGDTKPNLAHVSSPPDHDQPNRTEPT